MKCSHCGQELPDGSKYCFKCGKPQTGNNIEKTIKNKYAKKTSRLRKKVLLVISMLLIICVVIVMAALSIDHESIDKSSGIVNIGNEYSENSVMLDVSDLNIRLEDRDSALETLKIISKEIGIDNAEDELKFKKEYELADSIFYRFQQMYQEVPVYGREIIISAGNDNMAQAISHNYMKISSMSTSPAITEDEASLAVEKIYGEQIQLLKKGLTIYSLYGAEPTLAWQYYAVDENNADTCFVDADTGEVIAAFSNILTETALGSYTDSDGTIVFNTTKIEDNEFLLKDTERQIEIYDAEAKKTKTVIIDGAGVIYEKKEVNGKLEFVDSNQNVVRISWSDIDGQWKVYDSNDNVVGENIDFFFGNGKPLRPLNILSNSSDKWTNKKAATAMALVGDVYDFFYFNYDREGFNNNFNNKKGTVRVAINNNGGGKNNASQEYGQSYQTAILNFGSKCKMGIDVVAHEYMHAVEQSTSTLNYQGESGAIMEALSDVFGEMAEDWLDGGFDDSCDWKGNYRNYADPGSKNYPVYYQGKNYYYGEDDHGGVHRNSTVLSHAFYFMTHAHGGKTDVLTNEELARLLYITMGYLTSNCNFDTFATNVWFTSGLIGMSDEKRMTIAEAFELVGIERDMNNILIVPISEEKNTYMADWVVEPTIEADDIYYLADYPNPGRSVNEFSKQANNPNAVIQRGNELGIIDLDGKLLTEIAYKEIANFGDSYMMTRTNPEYSEELGMDWDTYWLDDTGKVEASVGNGVAEYSVYYYYNGIRQRTGCPSSDFIQEVIPVQNSSVYHLQDISLVMDNLFGKYALEYDCNLITDFIYDECGSLSDGLFAVCQNGKWGYVNEKGETVIPIEYDASWQQYPILDGGSRRSSSRVKEYCYAASDGFVVLCQDGEWELRDVTGNSIIPKGTFEAIRPVFDKKCWVKKDGKWGVIRVTNNR